MRIQSHLISGGVLVAKERISGSSNGNFSCGNKVHRFVSNIGAGRERVLSFAARRDGFGIDLIQSAKNNKQYPIIFVLPSEPMCSVCSSTSRRHRPVPGCAAPRSPGNLQKAQPDKLQETLRGELVARMDVFPKLCHLRRTLFLRSASEGGVAPRP